ncbi:MAG: hypothetical protein ABSB56_02950 [Nitrososphaerales archaeon]|jgi:phage anti-repressor protein
MTRICLPASETTTEGHFDRIVGVRRTFPKSTFLRGLIRNASFSNSRHRRRVYDLLRLEKHVTDGYQGWADAVHYGFLKNQYRYEWERICEELKPKEWSELVRKGQQTRAMLLDMKKTIDANRREEEEKARRWWRAAGGRP